MPDSKTLHRIESDGPDGAGLSLWPAMDPKDLISGTPVEHGHLYDEIEDEDYSVGVWDCTAFVDAAGPYPVDEYMLLLEGSVIMEMPDKTSITVNAGDAFIIPKGFDCQWKMPGTVRKIFMILDGGDPKGSSNLSENQITVLRSGFALPVSTGLVSTRQTLFINHDGRMSVFVEGFAHAFAAKRTIAERQIVSVISGQVQLSGDGDQRFSTGDSFYTAGASDLHWDIAAGTQLLVSQCNI